MNCNSSSESPTGILAKRGFCAFHNLCAYSVIKVLQKRKIETDITWLVYLEMSVTLIR